MSTTSAPPQPPPLRSLPGSYGWPVVGPVWDKLNYFWFQGPVEFYKKGIEKNKSTVFRTNVPPSFPLFVSVNPKVVALLDTTSYSHMFDPEIADKRDTLLGDFMPSLGYTGGQRTVPYLDTEETKHTQIKRFGLDILKRGSKLWVSELQVNLEEMWTAVEAEVSAKGSSSFASPMKQSMFKFINKVCLGAEVSKSPEIAKSGMSFIDRWFFLMVFPTININVVQPLEEIFLHSFAYPPFLVRGGYNKLIDFIKTEGRETVQRGMTEYGLTEEETVHNLFFMFYFNCLEGFNLLLPDILGRLFTDKTGLQDRLRAEARQNGGPDLTFEAVKQMPNIRSLVWETLRFKPPVPTQYSRARKDFRLSSHDASYEIKKGELLCGYLPLVMRDPVIFNDPDTFQPDRFVGEKGTDLLKYLYWSNGPETADPTATNKQCMGKDYVTLSASMLVAYILRRYDSIKGDSSKITAVEMAK
ncbi:unnamed protein product [Linum trigynum]|uniref:Cytochrome P450 n=1 Tax=Linum trigynum TaxID=586398 RepID=A0AAV2F6S3_9ROSI